MAFRTTKILYGFGSAFHILRNSCSSHNIVLPKLSTPLLYFTSYGSKSNWQSSSWIHTSAMAANLDEVSSDLERKLTGDVLGIEMLDTDLYRGTRLWKPAFARAVFGGQIVGQALVAAGSTVPKSLNVHSMHSYFVRPGDPDMPVIYRVTRTRDGASFTSRTVTAIQRGVPILTLQASFHNEENEKSCQLEYQPVMPPYKHHSELKTPMQIAEAFAEDTAHGTKLREMLKHLTPELPIEIKPIDPQAFLRTKQADSNQLVFWVRACGQIGDNQKLHRCIASYISDWSLLWSAVATQPHLKIAMMASLDHTMWFHNPFHIDEWMLYECTAITAGHNRALCHGRLYREDGRLAVTIAQEGVIRPKM